MPIRDLNIDWLRKQHWISSSEFMLFSQPAEATGTGASQNVTHGLGATPNLVIAALSELEIVTTPADMDIALGTHTPSNVVLTQPNAEQKVLVTAGIVREEFGARNFGAIRVMATDESHVALIRCPPDVDPYHAVGFRVYYLKEQAVADTYEWKVTYGLTVPGVTALAAGSTALSTVIPVHTASATGNTPERTDRGILNANFTTRDNIEAGLMLGIRVELEDTTATLDSEECGLVGVEMDYVPWMTRGHGNSKDRSLYHDGA